MGNKGEMSFTFTREGILGSYTDPKGIAQQKLIDPKEFASLVSVGANINTGLLPLGTRYMARSGGITSVIVEIPPGVRKLMYSRTATSYTVPLPRLVFAIGISEKDQSVKHVAVYASKFPLILPTVELYRFPFGNVYTGSPKLANICWGSVPFPAATSLSVVPEVITMFLDSNFNGDLIGTAYNGVEGLISGSLPALLEYLKDKETFDERILIQEQGLTMGVLMKMLNEQN